MQEFTYVYAVFDALYKCIERVELTAVNMQGGYHIIALYAAFVGAHETKVRMLLRRGANVGLDVRLKSAIYYAVDGVCCIPSLVNMLQQYGALLDTIDVDNMMLLHYLLVSLLHRFYLQYSYASNCRPTRT
jgi:hypothetical protein